MSLRCLIMKDIQSNNYLQITNLGRLKIRSYLLLDLSCSANCLDISTLALYARLPIFCCYLLLCSIQINTLMLILDSNDKLNSFYTQLKCSIIVNNLSLAHTCSLSMFLDMFPYTNNNYSSVFNVYLQFVEA